MASAEVIKKDFMQKRSQMRGRIKAENYRYRWFELTATVLRYSDGSLESGPRGVKGQINLNQITAVERADGEHLGNRKFAFQVVYKVEEPVTLYIMASSEAQQNEWITLIRNGTASRTGTSVRPLPETPPVAKGEEYELLEALLEDVFWVNAKNKAGKTGYIPTNYIQLDSSLEQYDWFYSNTSRVRSEEILHADGREGVFLVRDSSQKDTYTLSVFTRSGGTDSGIVKHYHIKLNANGQYYLSDKHAYDTIPELIYYHKHNCADLKEIDVKELEFLEELGTGQFGTVQRGRYKKEVEVAIKMMKEGTMQEEDFIDEAKTMMQLQHAHLVKLYGVCTKQRPILILTEYMRNGALLSYLRRHKGRLLANTELLVDMCSQVCSAMEYLESKNFIHRDLAARNCLVGEKNIVKVGDFGLARHLLDNEYTSSAGARFPVRWSAPEVLNYTKFSSKSDVWAYGVLVWEIFTGGDMPYGKMRNADVVESICQKNDRLMKPAKCPDNVYRIMISCWSTQPEERPSFAMLRDDIVHIQSTRDYE